MPGWDEIAADNFQSANCLGKAGHWRSCVSRAYYAAFSAVTHVLTGKVTFRQNREAPDHKEVPKLIDCYLKDLPDASKVTKAVRRLYNGRLEADYKSGRTVDKATALGARRDAYTVCKYLKVLR
jgi:uncharacterized protein (UPF0332 family)